MRRRKKNELWYNAYDKEVGGILLEGREAVLRFRGPCPDARTGLRLMGARLELPTDIL